jgi:exosortase/archaeosortase family protein
MSRALTSPGGWFAAVRSFIGRGGEARSFLLRFFLLLFVGSLAFSIGNLHAHLDPLQSVIAYSATVLARLLGTPVDSSGPIIVIRDGYQIFVNHECTGIFFLVIWAAFVLAHRAHWKARALGFFGGAAIMEIVNVTRLATLAAVGARWPTLFDYFHEYLWQGIFVVLIAVLAALWRDAVERQALVPR